MVLRVYFDSGPSFLIEPDQDEMEKRIATWIDRFGQIA